MFSEIGFIAHQLADIIYRGTATGMVSGIQVQHLGINYPKWRN
jgi:hypothetical protein